MSKIARQRGLTLPELLLYVGIVGGVATFVAVFGGDVFSGSSQRDAFAELGAIKSAAEQYRSAPVQAGLYTSVSITQLHNKGYLRMMDSGTNENAYGMTVEIAGANSNTDATITYPTASAEDCQRFLQALTGSVGVKTITCATGTLTMTIE